MRVFRKETVFEGYFVADYETSYLSKEYEFSDKHEGVRLLTAWFYKYLQQLVKNKAETEHSSIIKNVKF